MAQPAQPGLRDDPYDVRQVLPTWARPTLDSDQAITGRHAQGELRQLPAHPSTGGYLGQAAVACALGEHFIGDNAEDRELAAAVADLILIDGDGFIKPDGAGRDIFLHRSQMLGSGARGGHPLDLRRRH